MAINNTTTTITHNNNLVGSVGSSTQLKYLFPEHVIVVEPEELDACSDDGSNNNLATTVSESTNIWDDAYTEGDFSFLKLTKYDNT